MRKREKDSVCGRKPDCPRDCGQIVACRTKQICSERSPRDELVISKHIFKILSPIFHLMFSFNLYYIIFTNFPFTSMHLYF